MPTGGKKKKTLSQKEFFTEYLNSPNYIKRLQKQGYEDPKGAIALRKANMDVTSVAEVPGMGSQYHPKSQTIVIDRDQLKDYNLDYEGTLAHEYSHTLGALEPGYPKMPFPLTLSEREKEEINKRNRLTGLDLVGLPPESQLFIMHDQKASEVKADLDELRYFLKRDGIYDTGTQEFNKDILNRAKKKYKGADFTLFDNFSDEDLIYLMNNIAANQKTGTTAAKNGKYMKVRPKYFDYESLPCVGCKDHLMAESGMYMEPGPRFPGGIKIPGITPLEPSIPQGPVQIGSIDTDKIKPGRFLGPADLAPQPQLRKEGPNYGNAALLALSAFDALLPNPYSRQTVVQPQMAYNPNPYGTGSQALMQDGGTIPIAKDGKWIQKAINPDHKGYCTPMTKSTCTPRRKALAKTLKKMAKKRKKDFGGIIPDNMSPFSPHEYKSGGNVNGGADIRMVGPSYPNTDLLEQWLLYEYGGDVNGCAKIKEVGPNYPNTDLMEQWLLYKNGGSLSPDKAKEILKDGKANGKKLTKKQKQYFGMVAAGKAAAGDVLTGGGGGGQQDPPVKPLQRPIKDDQGIVKNTFSGEASFTDNQFAMGHYDKRMAQGIDLINSIIASGMLPHQTDRGGVARQSLDPQMLSYLYQFNQRPDVKYMSPDQRVEAFYSIPSNNPNIQSMKDNMKRYGYGPSEFRRGQTISDAAPLDQSATVSTMRSGGVLYDDGGMINTMWGGNAELESYNPYDGGTVEFNGASHAQGGIGMAYNGNPVEVEGGEYAARDPQGNLNIFGNMYIPGTKTKFKSAAKAIADKEKRYDSLKTKGSDLVNNSNPANKWEQLAFNAGKVMMQGGSMGQADLASKKDRLASLQRAMLDMAAEHGLDPFEMSKGKMKKAKGGASIPFYQNGGDPEPTVADRNNNPGNIKWGAFAKKYGAKKGGPAPDGGYWAIFPSRDKGLSAMKGLLKSDNYKNLDIDSAIRKWTGGHPYRYDLSSLKGKKINDLKDDEFETLVNTMVKGEGTTYGMTPRKAPQPRPNVTAPRIPDPGPFTPYGLPNIPIEGQTSGDPTPVSVTPSYDILEIPTRRPISSNVESLDINQVLPEIFAAATNKVEPVPTQRYEPQLYVPYQVSFQDRVNANQAIYNAQARAVGASNPSALGALAAQTYAANSNALADEFRTNQAIANDITNKNIALVNDANLKNLGIADTQMVRQSQARSNTRAQNQVILNSLSSKYAQNELENKRLAVYENLYDYRFVPQEDGGLSATYFGPSAMFNYEGRNPAQKPQDVRTISRYDAQGNLKGYAEYDDSDLREQQRLLDMIMKIRNLPLLNVPPLNK